MTGGGASGRAPDAGLAGAWRLAPDELSKRLAADPEKGLTARDSERRLAEHGPNELAGSPASLDPRAVLVAIHERHRVGPDRGRRRLRVAGGLARRGGHPGHRAPQRDPRADSGAPGRAIVGGPAPDVHGNGARRPRRIRSGDPGARSGAGRSDRPGSRRPRPRGYPADLHDQLPDAGSVADGRVHAGRKELGSPSGSGSPRSRSEQHGLHGHRCGLGPGARPGRGDGSANGAGADRRDDPDGGGGRAGRDAASAPTGAVRIHAAVARAGGRRRRVRPGEPARRAAWWR